MSIFGLLAIVAVGGLAVLRRWALSRPADPLGNVRGRSLKCCPVCGLRHRVAAIDDDRCVAHRHPVCQGCSRPMPEIQGSPERCMFCREREAVIRPIRRRGVA